MSFPRSFFSPMLEKGFAGALKVQAKCSDSAGFSESPFASFTLYDGSALWPPKAGRFWTESIVAGMQGAGSLSCLAHPQHRTQNTNAAHFHCLPCLAFLFSARAGKGRAGQGTRYRQGHGQRYWQGQGHGHGQGKKCKGWGRVPVGAGGGRQPPVIGFCVLCCPHKSLSCFMFCVATPATQSWVPRISLNHKA